MYFKFYNTGHKIPLFICLSPEVTTVRRVSCILYPSRLFCSLTSFHVQHTEFKKYPDRITLFVLFCFHFCPKSKFWSCVLGREFIRLHIHFSDFTGFPVWKYHHLFSDSSVLVTYLQCLHQHPCTYISCTLMYLCGIDA